MPDAYVAWDVVTGAFRQAMLKIGGGAARPDYADSVVRLCLQALGVRTEKIREIMALPLPH